MEEPTERPADPPPEEPIKPHHIVIGQHVMEANILFAQQMRQQMTPSEAKLWARLRGSRLDTNFRRQQIIHGFYADFYCHGAALVLEVDGPIHDDQQEYDAARSLVFTGLGITVLRFTNAQVDKQIGVVLYQVKRWLRTHPGTSADPPETGGWGERVVGGFCGMIGG